MRKNEVEATQTLFLGASLTGIGTVWRNCLYATPVREIPGFMLTIVHLEMFNIFLALRVWGNKWHHSSIRMLCDNDSVVQVIRTGKTRDPFLALCIRNIWLHTAHYDIDLVIDHVLGKKKRMADTLSRIYSSKSVDKIILQNLLEHYQWEKVLHSHFDLSLHI